MVHLLTIVFLSVIAIAARAQDQSAKKSPAASAATEVQNPAAQAPSPGHIDLMRDPQPAAAPAPGLKPNSNLLLPAGSQTGTKTYSTIQTTTGPNGTTQQVNATSSQFNLGGQKATNTIYYDNSGRMTGSGTSIKIGGK